ncbi:NAD-dependent epimerase/dehydratase family protein [Cryobacterium sp. 1639]|uniref:NAD-dependent epimerase/dehydratase family protein n=1 Tax=Cryobacterium inferilacus TaxID=2866629 RepID=UPI001C72D6D0|nr:NAD-dependent epimerase/dehydratase family protein [Cryobacterium sp. 1639]MBX0300067.1 NAD-dependent epimerase/dehydratase family protein [Cryobacterium sp. 1639]
MPTHLIVGAGWIGRELARQLVARGDNVTVATRSGTAVAGGTARMLDASDPVAFVLAAERMDTIFLCTNPPYPDWARRWPPVFAAAIAAASVTGATLVSMGNLYPYGSPTGPMTEHSPETTTESKGLIRRAGWRRMLDAHERGEIRAVEVRASDYFGPGVSGTAHLGQAFFSAVLASKTARVVGRGDLVHSWSYIPDIAATLIAAAGYTGSWGRIWHVPSGAHSRTEIATQLNARYTSHGVVAGYPDWMLRSLGAVSPLMREVYRSSYQFQVPYVIDSLETERELGVAATAWDEALVTVAESYRR